MIRSIFLTVNNDLPLTTSLSRSNPENQELNRIEQEQERKESKRGSPSRGAAILILWPSFTSSQPNPLNLRIPLPSRRREMDSISHLHTPIILSSSHSTPGATGTPSSPAANSNSPHHSLNPNHPSSSSSQSQAQAPFALDAFDFSSQDFTLPSNMDELNLFTHQQTGTTSGGSGSHSNVDSPSNHSQKFDDLSSQQLQSIIQSAMASANNTTSSNSSNSPSQSHPSPISHSSHSNNLKINTGQQGGNGNNLTIQDLHRILMEKEQSERMQNMQTQVLRQQLETLQQMSKHQVESSNNNNNGFLNQHSGNHSNNYLPYFGKDQQQHQGSSNSTPGGTHHSSPNHPSYQKGSSPPTSSNNNYQNHGLPIPSSGAPASVIAQYGLMTPMGSGAFGNSVFNNGHGAPTNGQPPFVSPLDMPHGHGNEMDGHHMNHQPWRGQDVSTKRGGGKEFGARGRKDRL